MRSRLEVRVEFGRQHLTTDPDLAVRMPLRCSGFRLTLPKVCLCLGQQRNEDDRTERERTGKACFAED